MAAATIVRFQPNVPQTLQLKEAQGRPVNGRYGHQYHHVLVDGRAVYVHPIVEEKLADLEIRDGDAVEITKRVEGDVTRWAVRRAEAPASNDGPAQVPAKSSEQEPSNGNGRSGASKLATGALIAAIDSLMDAREYAVAKGLDVEVRLDFNAEDVRALAATMLIQHYRRVENDERYGKRDQTWAA